MKILLVEPAKLSKSNPIIPNLGLGYLASVLDRDGHEVFIADVNFFHNPFKEIEKLKPDIVGIHFSDLGYYNGIDVAKFAKKHNCMVIFGGPHVSLLNDSFFKKKFIDYSIDGEAEHSFPKLLKKLESGQNPKNIPGLIFRLKNKIIKNKPERIKNLDDLPFPNYSYTNTDIENYPIATSRGCPNNCIFCCTPTILGKQWISRYPKNVIKELNYAKKKYKLKSFLIVDSNFSHDIERAKEICRLLISEKINLKWNITGGIRADKFDEEFAILMKKAKCQSIGFGIETVDFNVFKKIKKAETLEQIKNSIKICQKVGLPVQGYFIIGLPGATYESEMKSLEFAKKMNISASWSHAEPYPGTELYDLVSNRIIYNVNDMICDFSFHSEPYFETREFCFKDRKKAYIICNLKMGNYLGYDEHNILYATIELFYNVLKYDPVNIFYYLYDIIKRFMKKIQRLNL